MAKTSLKANQAEEKNGSMKNENPFVEAAHTPPRINPIPMMTEKNKHSIPYC